MFSTNLNLKRYQQQSNPRCLNVLSLGTLYTLPMISQTKNTCFKKFPLRPDSKQLKYGRPAGPRDILTEYFDRYFVHDCAVKRMWKVLTLCSGCWGTLQGKSTGWQFVRPSADLQRLKNGSRFYVSKNLFHSSAPVLGPEKLKLGDCRHKLYINIII